MYKCWLTFIKPYVIVPYRTVGMLIGTWYHEKKHESLKGHM